MRAKIEISSNDFRVDSNLYTSTGEIHQFFQALKVANNNVAGEVKYNSYEGNLELNLAYDKKGHLNVNGVYTSNTQENNHLKFKFITDQSFITHTLAQLIPLIEKYEGMKGVK